MSKNHLAKSSKPIWVVWVLKLFLNFQTCTSREWAAKAGKLCNAHSNTVTEDNEQGRLIWRAKTGQREQWTKFSFSKKTEPVSNKETCSTAKTENLCNFCSAEVHHWYELVTPMSPIFTFSKWKDDFAFIMYYFPLWRLISCGERKVSIGIFKIRDQRVEIANHPPGCISPIILLVITPPHLFLTECVYTQPHTIFPSLPWR